MRVILHHNDTPTHTSKLSKNRLQEFLPDWVLWADVKIVESRAVAPLCGHFRFRTGNAATIGWENGTNFELDGAKDLRPPSLALLQTDPHTALSFIESAAPTVL